MNRRQFSRGLSAVAGLALANSPLLDAAQLADNAKRRTVKLAGRRVKTVDCHAHCLIYEAWDLVKSYPWAEPLRVGMDNKDYGYELGLSGVDRRIEIMDAWGIDVQAVGVSPFWYPAERAIASELIDLQNKRLANFCSAHPDRFVGMATVALQFPDLAAEQLEYGVRKLGMRGCMIGGSVNGADLSARQFDPFWAKAEELDTVVFIHPQNEVFPQQLYSRLQGNGFLINVIAHPLETTIALSHLIWDGTLDRYPGLKICAAHGGGFLPSYIGRSEACFDQVSKPGACKPTGKPPNEYLKQLYFDSMVFTPEGLRHLAAETGASQIMVGTDFPYRWTSRPVDLVLETPGLTTSEREAILGGTAIRLLRIDS